MPSIAPDFYTLYDFETQMETAWQAVLVGELTAASIVANVYISQQLVTKETPWIEIKFLTGEPMSQRTTQGQAVPKQVPNAFTGRLTATIYTTRALTTANAELHGKLRGLCRYCLSAAKHAITGTNLPYLQILEQLPTETQSEVFDEKEQDISQLTYAVWFAINNESWPTS